MLPWLQGDRPDSAQALLRRPSLAPRPSPGAERSRICARQLGRPSTQLTFGMPGGSERSTSAGVRPSRFLRGDRSRFSGRGGATLPKSLSRRPNITRRDCISTAPLPRGLEIEGSRIPGSCCDRALSIERPGPGRILREAANEPPTPPPCSSRSPRPRCLHHVVERQPEHGRYGPMLHGRDAGTDVPLSSSGECRAIQIERERPLKQLTWIRSPRNRRGAPC